VLWALTTLALRGSAEFAERVARTAAALGGGEAVQEADTGICDGMFWQGRHKPRPGAQLRQGRRHIGFGSAEREFHVSGQSLTEPQIARRGQAGHDFSKGDDCFHRVCV